MKCSASFGNNMKTEKGSSTTRLLTEDLRKLSLLEWLIIRRASSLFRKTSQLMYVVDLDMNRFITSIWVYTRF